MSITFFGEFEQDLTVFIVIDNIGKFLSVKLERILIKNLKQWLMQAERNDSIADKTIACENLFGGTRRIFFIFCERFFVKSTSFWALVGKSKCFYSQEI